MSIVCFKSCYRQEIWPKFRDPSWSVLSSEDCKAWTSCFWFFSKKNIFRRPSSLQIDPDLMNYFLLGRCPFRFAENVRIVKELLKCLARTRLVSSSSGTSLTNSGKGGESIFIAICANTCKSMNHTDAVLLRPPSV